MSELKPGEFIRVPGKNPKRTGAASQVFEVLEVQYKVRVRYTEGQEKGCVTNFVIPLDKAREYRAAAPVCQSCGHADLAIPPSERCNLHTIFIDVHYGDANWSPILSGPDRFGEALVDHAKSLNKALRVRVRDGWATIWQSHPEAE